ncbi:MAG: HAD-IA family hydrolase [Ginsengibacter sp.]
MKPNYKILFSDIGGVLLSNGWPHEARQAAAEKFRLDFNEMTGLHNFIFNVFEIGKVSLDEYLSTVVFNHQRDFSREEFWEFMLSQSCELPQMLPWLVDWKRRNPAVKIISINNEARDLNNYRIKKFRLHDFFDAFVSSCEVGMRKPDPGIFRLALGIAQAAPEECLYFDDREMLVAAARKEGIHAHHHENFKTTCKIIEDAFS